MLYAIYVEHVLPGLEEDLRDQVTRLLEWPETVAIADTNAAMKQAEDNAAVLGINLDDVLARFGDPATG